MRGLRSSRTREDHRESGPFHVESFPAYWVKFLFRKLDGAPARCDREAGLVFYDLGGSDFNRGIIVGRIFLVARTQKCDSSACTNRNCPTRCVGGPNGGQLRVGEDSRCFRPEVSAVRRTAVGLTTAERAFSTPRRIDSVQRASFTKHRCCHGLLTGRVRIERIART